jgi:hypothetical protein
MADANKNDRGNRSKLPAALQGVRPPGPGEPAPPPRPSSAPAPALHRPAIPTAAPAPPKPAAPTPGHPARSSAPGVAPTASNRGDLADAISRTAWDAARAEDASVIAPAPPVSALGLQHVAPSRQADPLAARRTLIPILLTAGALLIGIGTYLHIFKADDAVADLLAPWAPLVFIALGVLSAALGIVNVFSVRNALAGRRGVR